ncbi:MAG TPA: PQQ-binding-like beta-propeller repeat protein [Acidimicrobiales bacterium]|nr:PQQ-binding-like beta-propeller repeat protein [Acidimicrobiales bacterium]
MLGVVVLVLLRLGFGFVRLGPHPLDDRPPTARLGAGGCPGLQVTPARGQVAWTVRSTAGSTYVPFDPLAVDGGFVVAAGGCIASVDTGGRLRWSIRGSFSAAAASGGTVVLSGFEGWPRVVALDAATGRRRWTGSEDVRWGALAAGDGSVLLGGTAIAVRSAAEGRRLDTGRDAGRFPYVLAQGGLLVAGGSSPSGSGAVVAFDRTGRTVTDAKVDIAVPRPVAVTAEVIVVQSDRGASGAGPPAAASEPVRLAGIARTTGAVLWTRPLPDLPATAVAAGDVLVVAVGGVPTGIEAASGRTLWEQPNARDIVAVGDRTVAVATNGGAVQALDARTGVVRWTTPPIPGRLVRLVATGEGAVLVATSDDWLRLLRAADGAMVVEGAGPRLALAASRDLELPPVAVTGGVWATRLDDGGVAGVRVG